MIMRTSTRLALLMVIAGATIGCDRITKHIATTLLAGKPTQSLLADTVRLTYAENAGGFLSLGAELPPVVRTALFTVMTGLMLLLMTGVVFGSRWPLWRTAGLTLVVAGGASNWIDRLLRGSVVDFLNIGVGWFRTGIFNLADVAIMLGVGWFVLAGISASSRAEQPPSPSGS
jgi:signal peptidase II